MGDHKRKKVPSAERQELVTRLMDLRFALEERILALERDLAIRIREEDQFLVNHGFSELGATEDPSLDFELEQAVTHKAIAQVRERINPIIEETRAHIEQINDFLDDLSGGPPDIDLSEGSSDAQDEHRDLPDAEPAGSGVGRTEADYEADELPKESENQFDVEPRSLFYDDLIELPVEISDLMEKKLSDLDIHGYTYQSASEIDTEPSEDDDDEDSPTPDPGG